LDPSAAVWGKDSEQEQEEQECWAVYWAEAQAEQVPGLAVLAGVERFGSGLTLFLFFFHCSESSSFDRTDMGDELESVGVSVRLFWFPTSSVWCMIE
jgi:hypothetical protein